MPPTSPQDNLDNEALRHIDVVLHRVELRLARVAQDLSRAEVLAAEAGCPAIARLLDRALDHKQAALRAVEDAHSHALGALRAGY